MMLRANQIPPIAPGRRFFRILLVATAALMLASGVAGWGEPSPALALALEAEPDPFRDASPALLLALAGALLGVMGASLFGLYGLRAWGRSLAWWSTVAGFFAYPLFGVSVYGPLESMLVDAANIGWGALLALAYFSPLSAEFLPSGRGGQGEALD